MNKPDNLKYSINLSFEEIKLPPFHDILVLGKHSTQGKIGLSKSFELLVPNSFEVYEIKDSPNVEAIFINKRLLSKMESGKIIEILRSKVFPFVAEGDILKVDFQVIISYSNIEL